jgi:hypothetical protein
MRDWLIRLINWNRESFLWRVYIVALRMLMVVKRRFRGLWIVRVKMILWLEGNDDPPDRTPHKARELLLPRLEGPLKGGQVQVLSWIVTTSIEVESVFKNPALSRRSRRGFLFSPLLLLTSFLSGSPCTCTLSNAMANVSGTDACHAQTPSEIWGDQSGHGSPFQSSLPIKAES